MTGRIGDVEPERWCYSDTLLDRVYLGDLVLWDGVIPQLPVSHNATGPGDDATTWFNSSVTATWTHPGASGVNPAVVVGMVHYASSGDGVNTETRTATYGDVPMVSLGAYNFEPSSRAFIEVFGLLDPPEGPQTVSVRVQGSTTGRSMTACSMSYVNVGSFDGVVFNRASSGSSISVTSPSAEGEMVVSVMGAMATMSGYNQTERYYDNGGGSPDPRVLIGDAVGTGSDITFSATRGGSGTWAAIAVRVVPAVLESANEPVEVSLASVANAAGEWWVQPMAVYQPELNRTVIGAIASNGMTKLVERRHDTGEVRTYDVVGAPQDDHCVPAIWVKEGRRSVFAWHRHNADRIVRLRIGTADGDLASIAAGSITSTFTTAGDMLSYTQMVHRPSASDSTKDAFWMFFRRSNIGWVIIPFEVNQATGAVTWGTEQTVFRSPGHQLYAAIAEDESGANKIVRVACYHNPADNDGDGIDHAIWYFEIDTATGAITCPDHPALSANVISQTGFPIDMVNVTPRIVDNGSTNSRRLFAVRSGPDHPAIAYADWAKATPDAATYKVMEFDGASWSTREYGTAGARIGYTAAANYIPGMAFESPSNHRIVYTAHSDGTTETLKRHHRDSGDNDVATTLVSQPTASGRVARPYAPYSPGGKPPFDVVYNNITSYSPSSYTSYVMSSEAV
ncbi:hypothetical protein [Mycobacterium phage PP]|uniref:Minor tail protein n=1 Tax=Mycobacterium phage PP TaxID=2077134 RepID=A0A2Z5XVD2_9CAUD|nr:hypothetical protein KIW36_gp16 [Mycobacterium phage PP]BBC53810.1 hypothetical protein [Mycobacterium phage PP]